MNRYSCGRGLAEHAPLSAKMAHVLGSVADNLEAHVRALDPNDAAARVERRAYLKLIDEHRRASGLLAQIAQEMGNYSDVPEAKHDPVAMTSLSVLEAFEGFVKRQRELLAVLEKRVEQDQKMLLEMVVRTRPQT